MTVALELANVTIAAGRNVLLRDFSLKLQTGEFTALLGPNGAGKTTALRAALGLARLVSGSVMLDGQPVSALSGRQRASKLAWLPQQSLVAEPLTALELVAAARFRFGESRASSEREAQKALQRVAALEFADTPVTRLSGGEHQRVAVAALLAQDSPLLLLDEPANHLDPAQQMALYRLIGELWREGRGVLCVTHDVNLLHHVLGDREPGNVRVIGLSVGAARFESGLDAADLPAKLGELFGVKMQALAHDGRKVFVAANGGLQA